MEACACKHDSFAVLSGGISEKKNKGIHQETKTQEKTTKKAGNINTYARCTTCFGGKIMFHSVFSTVLST